MANNKKCGIKRIFSAMMAAAIAATTAFSAMPVTAGAEDVIGLNGGIIDDTDGKFYAAEVTGATSAEWDGTVATGYAGGTGTAADPYKIANGQQLAYLAKQVDAGTTYEGVYFKLTADILLNDDVDDEPNEWNPIGGYTYYSGSYNWSGFNGTFDGANHKVIGMYINDTSTDSFGQAKGLFAQIKSGGTVKNVGVTDGRIVCAGSFVGGICGENSGTISNCYNTIKITSSSVCDCYGGVCGTNHGTIENSYNKGELYMTGGSSSDGKYHIGGVSGHSCGTIDGCYNTGRVYTTSSYVYEVGGVSGDNEGTVKDSYNTGEVNGYQRTGGVCGYNEAGTVKTSYNKGEVTGRYCYTGGVCGESYSSDATDTILKCYNEGDVICSYGSSGSDTYTGGICGELSGYLIKQCYNKGTVTNANNYYTAGICGYLGKGEIRECYNSGAISGRSTVAGITGYMYTNCVLENCYNMGAIKATNGYAGGVWAYSASSSANTMRNCYNIGSVSASTAYPVGENDGQITNVYYDSDVVTATYSTNNDFARTTEQLTASTALDDLGFDTSVWTKKANTSAYWYYPDLKNIDGDQPKAIAGAPVPTGLKAAAGNRTVKLTWDEMEGAEKYAVYKYVDGKYTTLTSTLKTNSYSVTGLKNGVKVGFKVKTYFNGEWSDACNIVYATPKAPAPSTVKAAAGNKQAVISWTKVSGATKYAVYKYIDGKYTCLNSNITGTTYTVTGLANGTKYGFKVKAYVDQWSGASAMAYATPVNPVPTGVKATGLNTKATVTWNKVSGATKYAVYLYQDGEYTRLTNTLTTNTYTATGLTNGKKIGFKIKAYVNGAWSAASSIAYCTPVNPTPTGVKATGGNTKATVSWTAVSGAVKYAVYVYEDGVYTCVNSNIKTNSYTVTGLTNNKQYGFKVKAYVDGKWSSASSMAYATPKA